MTEEQKKDYNNYISCVTITTFGNKGGWDEYAFEEIYGEFCQEVFQCDWKHITDEESNWLKYRLKKTIELQARLLYILATEGYDALNNMKFSDEENKLLNEVNIKEMNIKDTDNTILKFLIWCSKLMDKWNV